MIILNNWYGRLGNNIQQIFNVISIALWYDQDIYFKVSHNLFDLKIIENFFNKYKKNSDLITDKHNFFYTGKLPFPKYVFESYNTEKINLMKKSFLIKDIDKLDKDDLVIHIRSGDLFKKNPHSYYIPPPLSYYIKQIDKNKYKQIIIVCEDKINPVVNKLLELYKNSIHNINSLQEDIKIILGATNIISSIGTFTFSLLIFSEHIKYHHGQKGKYKELKNYYEIMSPWMNTKEQRNYILDYKY